MAGKDPTVTVGMAFDLQKAEQSATTFANDLATKVTNAITSAVKAAMTKLVSAEMQDLRRQNPDVAVTVPFAVRDGKNTIAGGKARIKSLNQERADIKREEDATLREWERDENRQRALRVRADSERRQRANDRNRNLGASAELQRQLTPGGKRFTVGQAYDVLKGAYGAKHPVPSDVEDAVMAAEGMLRGGDPAAAKLKMASIGGELEKLQIGTAATRKAAEEKAKTDEKAAKEKEDAAIALHKNYWGTQKQLRQAADAEEKASIKTLKENLANQKRDETLVRRDAADELRRGRQLVEGSYSIGRAEGILGRSLGAGRTPDPALIAHVANARMLMESGDEGAAKRLMLAQHKALADEEAATAAQVKSNLAEGRKLAAQEKKEEKFSRYGLIYGSRTLISGIGGRVGDLLTGDPWANSMGGQAALGMAGDASKALSNFSAKSILANKPGVLNVTGLIGGAIGSEVMDVISKLAARGAGIAKYATGVQSGWMANIATLTGDKATEYDWLIGNTVWQAAQAVAEDGMAQGKTAKDILGQGRFSTERTLREWGFNPSGGMGTQVQYKREQANYAQRLKDFAVATGGEADAALSRIAGASQGARLSQGDIGEAFGVLNRQGLASAGKGVGSMLAARAFGGGGSVDASARTLARAAGAFNLGPGGLEPLQQMQSSLTMQLLGLGATGEVGTQSANAFGSMGAAGVSMARVPQVLQSYLGDAAKARQMLGGNAFGQLRASATFMAALNRGGGNPLLAAGEVGNVSLDEQRDTANSLFGSELSTTAFNMGGMSRGEAERFVGGKGQLPSEEVTQPKMGWIDQLTSAYRTARNKVEGAKDLGEIDSLERAGMALDRIAIRLDQIVSGLGMTGLFTEGY